MDKKTLIGVGLLAVVIIFSLEWLRSGLPRTFRRK